VVGSAVLLATMLVKQVSAHQQKNMQRHPTAGCKAAHSSKAAHARTAGQTACAQAVAAAAMGSLCNLVSPIGGSSAVAFKSSSLLHCCKECVLCVSCWDGAELLMCALRACLCKRDGSRKACGDAPTCLCIACCSGLELVG
jgi:hypothetical protein